MTFKISNAPYSIYISFSKKSNKPTFLNVILQKFAQTYLNVCSLQKKSKVTLFPLLCISFCMHLSSLAQNWAGGIVDCTDKKSQTQLRLLMIMMMTIMIMLILMILMLMLFFNLSYVQVPVYLGPRARY